MLGMVLWESGIALGCGVAHSELRIHGICSLGVNFSGAGRRIVKLGVDCGHWGLVP